MPTNCTIAVSRQTREELAKYKIIPDETYENVIKRLLEQKNHTSLPKEQKRLIVKH